MPCFKCGALACKDLKRSLADISAEAVQFLVDERWSKSREAGEIDVDTRVYSVTSAGCGGIMENTVSLEFSRQNSVFDGKEATANIISQNILIYSMSPKLKESSQRKYQEPESKVRYFGIDEQTSLEDSGTVKFVIMLQILVANCTAVSSVIFRNYWLNRRFRGQLVM
ncbi:hypothetical protein GGX14DRAFT_390187 [Mycena pura]|uniref:Uncharacterized protein n=1 Tax=Mycena pura TaxID=153505 RepID=A0AAD6VPZ1_9AGAR|nr:hypothetical protein GGX14DRAFT_390187 [Mycena pura]